MISALVLLHQGGDFYAPLALTVTKFPKGKTAATVRVGEKGQIVIPKSARDLLNIRPGDTLLVLADEEKGIAIVKDEVIFQQFADIMGGNGE